MPPQDASTPLPPLRIGPVEIGLPVVQAALAGYSDWPERVIVTRLGAPYTIAEVMLDQFVVNLSRGKKAGRYIRRTDDEHPCGAQLMGSTADELAPAARKMVEARFDVIDVNLGCPAKKVVGKCRGGYLLGHPEAALEVVGRVRDAVPVRVPVTVKMRRGIDDTPESRERFLAIFDGAFRLGAAAVTVHGRTVAQRYEGPSSWDFLREVKEHAGLRTVLGSGDLFTPQDCLDMLARTGVDGVMVARGVIGNPWFFRQVRALAEGRPVPEPSVAEQREILVEHYRLAEEIYGPRRTGPVMRGFGIKYARMHPSAAQVRAAFIAVRKPPDWHAVIEQWYK